MSKTIRLFIAVIVFFLVLLVWERSGLIKVKSGQPEVPAQDEAQLDPQSAEVEKMVNSQTNKAVSVSGTVRAEFEK